jgi:riboflavin biosynthesis pyrimidine reductase
MYLWKPGELIPDPLAAYAGVNRSNPGGPCWVLAHMVGGLDGSAAIAGRVAELSTAPDAELFRLMRALADVVLVGAQTVRREGYGAVRLPPERTQARISAGKLAVPPLAIISGSLNFDWTAPAFVDPPGPSRTILITAESSDAKQRQDAAAVADVIVAGQNRVDPRAALDRLAEAGHRVVLCEGGPSLLGELVAEDLVDELCLTISPLMGGDPLPVSVTPPGARLRHFTLRHVAGDGDTLFLRYERGPR